MGIVAILFCDSLERIITAKPLYIISEGTKKNGKTVNVSETWDNKNEK